MPTGSRNVLKTVNAIDQLHQQSFTRLAGPISSDEFPINGILQLTLPLGTADADREVQITVEPVGPQALSPQEWRQRILETAGKWQGELERPEQGAYEQREPLS